MVGMRCSSLMSILFAKGPFYHHSSEVERLQQIGTVGDSVISGIREDETGTQEDQVQATVLFHLAGQSCEIDMSGGLGYG